MKILLLEPIYFIQKWPIEIYTTRSYFQLPPLSLLSIGAYFTNITHVIDGVNDRRYTPEVLAKILLKYNSPDCVIGMASHSNVGSVNAFYTLRLVKAFAPQALVIMGGHHATYFDKRWVHFGADIVIRHEAELIYADLIQKLIDISNGQLISEKDLLGTTFSLECFNRINKKTNQNTFLDKYQIESPSNWKDIFKIPVRLPNVTSIRTPTRPFAETLDEFQIPARQLLDYKTSVMPIAGKGYTTSLESARGCPFNCKYCSAGVMWGHRQRYKSVPRMIEEIQECLKLNIKKIYIIDESWGINVKRDMNFLQEIQKQGIDFSWGIQIRPDTILKNPEMMKLAGKLGCRTAFIGFESLNPDLLYLSNKNTNAAKFLKVRQIMNAADICSYGYFLIGLPGETKLMRKNTVYSMKRLSDISLLNPYMTYFKGGYQPGDIQNYSQKQTQIELDQSSLRPARFFFDTQKIDFLTMNKAEIKRIKEISKDIAHNYLRFLFNPAHIKELIFAKTERQKTKRYQLRFTYGKLIKKIFDFNPRYLLYFLKVMQ